jgi:hypothetical protein
MKPFFEGRIIPMDEKLYHFSINELAFNLVLSLIVITSSSCQSTPLKNEVGVRVIIETQTPSETVTPIPVSTVTPVVETPIPPNEVTPISTATPTSTVVPTPTIALDAEISVNVTKCATEWLNYGLTKSLMCAW